jgi:hypothetical protein
VFQISVPGGLFGSGGFDPLALQRQAEERGRAEREYQAAEAARLAALKAEVEERNRRQAEADAAKAAQVQPANISTYYDALRAGEDPSEFADILQSSLSDQGYITSGADMAEAGAYAPVEDLFIVPGGIDTSNVGEFAFDKTLEDFEGYAFDYGNISNENLKKFQEELMPVMAPEVAQAQLEGQSYQNALIQAYERSPQVQEIYAKYDISPQRISRNNASEYVYDPFTFGEIQTVDRSKGFMDYVGDVVEAGLPAIAGAGLFGPLAGSISSGLGATGAANTALTGALTGAATAGVTGGDPLTAALTGGLGGFADPLITGADLGTFGTAGARGLSSAAIAELTGGDPLQAGLLAAGMSLGKDALEALKTNDAVTASAGETTEEPSVVDKAKEAVEGVKETVGEVRDTIQETLNPSSDSPVFMENTVKDIVEDIGEDAFNKLSVFEYKDQLLKHGGQQAVDYVFGDEGAIVQSRIRQRYDALSPEQRRQISFDPSILRDYPVTERRDARGNLLFSESTPQRGSELESWRFGSEPVEPVTVDPQEIEFTEPKIERPVVPTPPGGGGGASSAAAPSAPATTVTAPAAPSATITPVVQPPTLTSPGSVTNALLTNTLATLASTTTPTTAPQPTVAPPVTPVATTAPTPEPTPVTTTEPTDILEDTVVDDTTAQLEAEAEAEAQRQAAEAQAAREAEAARLAEEARKAAEARAAAEAKAAAEKDAIAQAEARAEAAEARLAEQQAQAQADAAAADAKYGEAVAAGEAAGEARYGEGLGTGRGQGAGAGIGAGLGLGLLAGMGGGAGGGVGTGFTPKDFEDYKFRKTYEAPELLERTLPLQGYQAPQYSQQDYAQTIANEIRNLRSFPTLDKTQVQKRLGLFDDSLLQQAVMQNLYGAGGR